MAEVDAGALAPAVSVVPAVDPAPSLQPTAGAGDEPSEGTQPEAKPERTFTQSEVDKLAGKIRSQESKKAERAIRAEVERDFLRQQLEARDRPATAAKPEPGEPDPKDYTDFEKYQRDLVRWEVKQELRQEQEKVSTERTAKQEALSARERAERIQKVLIAPGAEKFEDFEELILGTVITEAMGAAILDSDVPVELGHYLGTHRDEAAKIAELSPSKQVRELAKIEARLSAAPKPTNTPAPIVPNRGNAAGSKSMLDMSQDEFEKHRKARLARK